MVVPGVGPASNRAVIELGQKFRGIIFPTLGFHPERFEHSEDDAREVLEMIASQRHSICAIGEVGLPWYGEQASDPGVLDAAKVRLARFARAAVALDLPLILHAPYARALDCQSGSASFKQHLVWKPISIVELVKQQPLQRRSDGPRSLRHAGARG